MKIDKDSIVPRKIPLDTLDWEFFWISPDPPSTQGTEAKLKLKMHPPGDSDTLWGLYECDS